MTCYIINELFIIYNNKTGILNRQKIIGFFFVQSEHDLLNREVLLLEFIIHIYRSGSVSVKIIDI